MSRNSWDRRLFATTRGRILLMLRKGKQTVDDLASALKVSDNAVRSQLHTLERDGFVTYEGMRRGAGKPAYLYRLAPDAERVFPKSYATVLETLLHVLGKRLPPAEIDAALADVGQHLAATMPPLTGTTTERMPAVLETLGNIGGLAELETNGDSLVIQGYDCPLSRIVSGHPQACLVLQSMLETVLEQPVTEACDKGDPPRCRFLIDSPNAS